MANTSEDDWGETYPANAEMVTAGAAEIRLLRAAVRNRIEKEHVLPASSGVGGEHKDGSAKIYIGDFTTTTSGDTLPTQRPDETTTLTVDDAGRLAYDTADGKVYLYDGSTWIVLIGSGTFIGEWFSCAKNTSYTITHNLGLDAIFQVQFSTSEDGSNAKVMDWFYDHSHSDFSYGIGAQVLDIKADTCIIRSGKDYVGYSALLDFDYYTTGYYRLLGRAL